MIKQTANEVRDRYPIVGMEFYTNGLRIMRESKLDNKMPRGRRADIMELSKSSLSRLAFTAQNTNIELLSMLTLSYGRIYPSDGVLLKKSLNRFLVFLKQRYHNLEYLWFLEFQKRGCPHLHILLSVEPPEFDRLVVADKWVAAAMEYAVVDREYSMAEIIDCRNKMTMVHAHKKAWEKLRSKNGAAGYVTKYATKTAQKQVPRRYHNVGRFWGNSRGVKPKKLFTTQATEIDVRTHLGKMGHVLTNCEIVPKYISTHGSKDYLTVPPDGD